MMNTLYMKMKYPLKKKLFQYRIDQLSQEIQNTGKNNSITADFSFKCRNLKYIFIADWLSCATIQLKRHWCKVLCSMVPHLEPYLLVLVQWCLGLIAKVGNFLKCTTYKYLSAVMRAIIICPIGLIRTRQVLNIQANMFQGKTLLNVKIISLKLCIVSKIYHCPTFFPQPRWIIHRSL